MERTGIISHPVSQNGWPDWTVESLTEDSVTFSDGRSIIKERVTLWIRDPYKALLPPQPECVHLGITSIPNNPLIKCLLPLLTTLSSASLKVLVPKEGLYLPAYTTMVQLNQQAAKGVTLLAGMMGPDYQGEMRCCYTMKARRAMSAARGFSAIPLTTSARRKVNGTTQ